MPITATITNLVKEDSGIRIFWQYSDGRDQNQVFSYDITAAEVKAQVKTYLDELNSRDGKLTALTTKLSGVVLT